MSPLAINVLVFLGVTFGALLGMLVSPKLPVQHQGAESKDVVRLGIGLVATTVAVALGLLISSAKSLYDTQNNEIPQLAANYILLDQALAYYGTETTDIRSMLHHGLANLLESDGSLRGATQSYLYILGNPLTEGALHGITRALASVGRAFICLDPSFTIVHASRLLDRFLGEEASKALSGRPVEELLGVELFGPRGPLRQALLEGQMRGGWRATFEVQF
jgi:hypothetical protein